MVSAELEIRLENHDDCIVLHVKGELERGAAPAARLRDETVSLAVDGPPRLVLDLGGVTTWDDGGFGAVVGMGKRVMTAGGRLIVAATPADLRDRFQRQGLDQRLEFRDTVEKAIQELSTRR
jgi:anti-sigma B factor antagonist